MKYIFLTLLLTTMTLFAELKSSTITKVYGKDKALITEYKRDGNLILKKFIKNGHFNYTFYRKNIKIANILYYEDEIITDIKPNDIIEISIIQNKTGVIKS